MVNMKILPGFELLNTASIAFDSLSVILNIGLICILQVHKTTLDGKTIKFAIAFAMLSVIFAITHMLTQPFFTAFNGMGLSFAASFIHESIYTQYIMNFVMSPCYIALLECGAFNFLYKYAATCNKSLYHRFDSHLFVFFLFSIAALWLLLYTYFGAVFFAPTTAFREKVAIALNDRFHTNFRNTDLYIGGIDSTTQNQEEGIGPVIALFNFLSLIFCCLGTMLICGWKIWRLIVSNKMPGRVRRLHKQALTLLVLQTINPLFFAVVPALVPVFFIQSGKSTPDAFSWFNAYALLFFPLLNPLIFVICTKDYRLWLLAIFCGRPRTMPKAPASSFTLTPF